MRSEELAAIEILKRDLGAHITATDDGIVPSHVEALFTLPGGRDGALEVTTLGDQHAMQAEAIAYERDWSIPNAKWAWSVNYGTGFRFTDLDEHLETIALSCEALDVTSLEAAMLSTPAFRWYEESDVRFRAVPDSARPGSVYPSGPGIGGGVSDSLEALPDWLENDMFPTPLIEKKVAKLARTGRAEQHLFARVHITGMPFALFDALGRLPTRALTAPTALAGVWLVPQFGNGTLVRWDVELGWSRLQLNP